MQNEDKGTSDREKLHPGGDLEVRVDGRKTPPPRSQVGIVIFYADNHYLASFNHDPRRVFHNMPELLTAIEVECEKLK